MNLVMKRKRKTKKNNMNKYRRRKFALKNYYTQKPEDNKMLMGLSKAPPSNIQWMGCFHRENCVIQSVIKVIAEF